MKKSYLIIGFIIIVVIIGFYFFSGPSITGNVVSESTSLQTGQVKEILFRVGSYEYNFDKDNVQVNQGDTVKVTFKNTGRIIHNWVLRGHNVGTAILKPGASQTVQFTADKSGTFEYFCSVPGHREKGMLGSLSVS